MKIKYLYSIILFAFLPFNIYSQVVKEANEDKHENKPRIILYKISASITNPKNGTPCTSSFNVNGNVTNIPDTLHLWLVVKPKESIGWWPQYSEIIPKKDGTWSGLVTIDGDNGKLIDIHLLLANSEANKSFNDYLTTDQKAATPRPSGARSLTHITVVKVSDKADTTSNKDFHPN